MSVTNNTYIIPNLASNTTFFDWYTKENNEIIAKLNLLQVYGVTSGDGILASTNSNGIATFTIGGTSGVIRSPLTFDNTVTFNGIVNVSNNTIQVYGITSGSVGYTFGTPLRVFLNNSQIGYTAAQANSPTNSEVFGVISSLGNSFATVALSGTIKGNFQGVYGKGLSAGCVYFLDGNNQGKISDNEPQVTGNVSKPIYLGLSGDTALVLQYRGNFLNAELSSYGSSGSNQIIFAINTGIPAYANANTEILLGDVLSYSPSLAATIQDSQSGNRIGYNGWFHSQSIFEEIPYIIGTVTDKDLVGSILYITVQLSGYTNVYSAYSNGNLYLTNNFDLNNRSNFPQIKNTPNSVGSNVIVATVYDTNSDAAVITIKSTSPNVQLRSGVAEGGIASSSTTTGNLENLLINGNYNVWQRTETGKYVKNINPGNILFADMWRRHDGICGSDNTKNYYIERASFSDYQNEVEGDSKYYINVKALGLSAISYPGICFDAFPGYTQCDHLMIGHVVPNAKFFDEKDITVSFYAKTSNINYSEILVYLARYTGKNLLDYKIIGSASLDTNWSRYNFTNFIPALGVTSTALNDDYCEIGFDLIPAITEANDVAISLATDVKISIASVVAGVGISTLSYHTFKPYSDQLNYCQQFYYTTYDRTERIEYPTVEGYTPSNSTPYIVPIPNYSSKVHLLPKEMRKIPTVTIFSPYTGTKNIAYNGSAQRELHETSGTKGYNNAIRESDGSQGINSVATLNTVQLNLLNGFVPYDQVYYHFVADSDYSI